MNKLSLEQRKIAEAQTLAFLRSLPPAKNNPFAINHALLESEGLLKKIINGLWDFINWFKKLTPSQLAKWRNEVFSNYTPYEEVQSTQEPELEMDIDNSPIQPTRTSIVPTIYKP